jgi:hypothetical protein
MFQRNFLPACWSKKVEAADSSETSVSPNYVVSHTSQKNVIFIIQLIDIRKCLKYTYMNILQFRIMSE